MDDALLVSMLHGLTDGNKQFQPFLRRQMLLVTVLRHRVPMTSSITK